MRQKITVGRVRAIVLALTFLILFALSPLLAQQEATALHSRDSVHSPVSERAMALSERILRGSIPMANESRFPGQDPDRTEQSAAEEARHDILFCLFLLLYFYFSRTYGSLWLLDDCPPPLIQQRALQRFLKRADGRKRKHTLARSGVWKALSR